MCYETCTADNTCVASHTQEILFTLIEASSSCSSLADRRGDNAQLFIWRPLVDLERAACQQLLADMSRMCILFRKVGREGKSIDKLAYISLLLHSTLWLVCFE